jgi:hypothetical protein
VSKDVSSLNGKKRTSVACDGVLSVGDLVFLDGIPGSVVLCGIKVELLKKDRVLCSHEVNVEHLSL